MARPAHPPTLIEYDPPLAVDGDSHPVADARRAAPSDKGDGKVDDILNSILPPRYVGSEGANLWETGRMWVWGG